MFEDQSIVKPGMTLPVNNHIDRLQDLLDQIASDLEESEKELHMLRGSITELSYISKEADQELNRFLVQNIASLKRQLLQIDRVHKVQLRQNRDKIAFLEIQQEDILQQVTEYSDHTQLLERRVGLANHIH